MAPACPVQATAQPVNLPHSASPSSTLLGSLFLESALLSIRSQPATLDVSLALLPTQTYAHPVPTVTTFTRPLAFPPPATASPARLAVTALPVPATIQLSVQHATAVPSSTRKRFASSVRSPACPAPVRIPRPVLPVPSDTSCLPTTPASLLALSISAA
jgi:hypothetical protein